MVVAYHFTKILMWICARGALDDDARQEELVSKLLLPLLAQGCRNDDEETSTSLRPALCHDERSLDGFPKPDLICENRACRQRRAQREQAAST